MIFRAIFWIGLVALLAPHEPDLGLGRPGAGAALSSPATTQPAANGLSRNGSECGSVCAGALPSVFHLSNIGLAKGLADVKAQIEEARRERTAPVKAI